MLELPVLTTERTVVRPFRPDDLDTVHRLYDTNWGEREAPSGSIEQRSNWLQFAVLGYREFAMLDQPPILDRALVRATDGQVMGAIGMVHTLAPYGHMPWHEDHGTPAEHLYTAEYGLFWAIGEAFRGQGYVTEAARTLIEYGFQTLHMKRWVATTEYDNLASQAVMQRLRMRIERNAYPDPPWLQIAAVLSSPDLR